MLACQCRYRYNYTHRRCQGKYNNGNYEKVEYLSASLKPHVEEVEKFERNDKVRSYSKL